jgi:hypothetical protein
MAILMQGTWNIQVIQKAAAREQRFVISGASSPNNGPHPGVVGSPVLTVSGFDWNITVQSKSGTTWLNSTEKIQFPTSAISGFNILSDDAGATPDLDFNDLVLHVTPVATSGATDYFAYGNVSCYKGFCRVFNPCFPRYIVIDSQIALNEALLNPHLRDYIQKVYPDKVFQKPIKLPIPIPDPPPFTPLMLPLQNDLLLPNKEATLFKRQMIEQPGIKKSAKDESAAMETFTAVSSARFTNTITGSGITSTIDKVAIAGFRDKIHLHCDVDAMPFAILRVLEYDRTDAEKAGGAYTGTGNRQVLGYAITDNFGNYVFRFQRTDFDDLSEVDVDMASGENIFVQAKPDLIIQLLDPEDSGSVLHESALYVNVGTFKKINICFPCVSGPKACSGQGIIQYIGDLLVIKSAAGTRGGDGNILGSTGKISNAGINLLCAAWQGRLNLIACLKEDSIKFYTVKYKTPGEPDSAWKLVKEPCSLPNLTTGTPPGRVSIRSNRTINGVPNTECYECVENSSNASDWITTSNLKAYLTTTLYVNDKYPVEQQGTVQFRIEGYKDDAAGSKIPTVDETIDLYLDNRGVEADIDPFIQMAGTTLGNCALFTLPFTVIDGVKIVTDEKTPITVRFRAKQESGFMGQYALSIAKGAIGNITLTRTAPAPAVFHTTSLPTAAGQTHVGRFYSDTGNLISCFFNGTPGEPGFPGDYIELTLRPENNWLDADQNFCAFRIRLDGHIRHTDGENSNPYFTTTEVLIGIERPE